MPESPERLHQRYLQQAGWTTAIRQRAFSRFGVQDAQRVLEVGSGTGAITTELGRATSGAVIGLDRDPRANAFARAGDRKAAFVTGLGEQLPFPAGIFDLVCSHFLLLWVRDPLAVLVEMQRVTRPGGAVVCLAEPDYGGRIEHPESLAELGALQEQALRAQGADTRLGRRLRHLLQQAGLTKVQAGVLGGEWDDEDAVRAHEQGDLEWMTLSDDLKGRVSPADLRKMGADFSRARRDGSHVLFIPTFFGWGIRPPHPNPAPQSPRQPG
jgi:SAM-dependent methyltransferase